VLDDDLELGDHEPGGGGEGEEADALDAGEVGQLGGAVVDAHGGGGQLAASGAVDRVEVPRHDEVAFRVGVQVEADVGVRGHVEEEAGVVGGHVLGVAVVGGVFPESRGNGEAGEARPLGEWEGELALPENS
jgi:hypothetical protein